jgi:hypothetical protein
MDSRSDNWAHGGVELVDEKALYLLDDHRCMVIRRVWEISICCAPSYLCIVAHHGDDHLHILYQIWWCNGYGHDVGTHLAYYAACSHAAYPSLSHCFLSGRVFQHCVYKSTVHFDRILYSITNADH